MVDFELMGAGGCSGDAVEGDGVGWTCAEATDIGGTAVVEAGGAGALCAFGLIGGQDWRGLRAVAGEDNAVQIGSIAGGVPERDGIVADIERDGN
jgi:hypothetical protein